ncbi:cytochrome P450 [Zopfochytrium polystomum]|nr:cytochrome P450 [Zopfochytrium polystomum]
MAPAGRSGVMAIGAAAAVAAAIAVWYYWERPVFHSPTLTEKKKLPPTVTVTTPPRPLPLLGDVLTILPNLHRFHDFLTEQLAKNRTDGERAGQAAGGFAIRLPFTPLILHNADPAVVEHILKNKFPIYDKGPFFFSRTKDVLGHGIFAVDGDLWRVQRKFFSHIFNTKKFKEYVGVVFVEEMRELSDRLDEAADARETVDIQDLFFRFTLGTIGRIGFGDAIGSIREAPSFATAFDSAQNRMATRFLMPLWWLVEAITPIGMQQARNSRTIRTMGRKIVEKRLEYIKAGGNPDEFSDVLSFMMASEDPLTHKPATAGKLVEYIVNLLLAALSWSVLMLHRNPAAKAALLSEIDRVLPEKDRNPTYEEVRTSMPYANAVFHETLRLYPSVPIELKEVAADDVLPTGVPVKEGTLVGWSLYAMGRSTHIWGPDAAEFRPERWLEMEAVPSPFVYPAFNGGPRVCLGKGVAELEGVFVLISLMKRFDVEVLDEEKVTYGFSLTLPMKGGMRVKLARRQGCF